MLRLKSLLRTRPGQCHRRNPITCSMAIHSTNGKERRIRRVAIIGAGAAGLIAARELRAEGHEVTVLEQSGGVGGVWRFDPRIEADDPMGVNPHRPLASRVHSSMYVNLRTNLPREIMSFSDFPFDSAFLGSRYSTDPRRFCSHKEVLAYLEAFADYHHLRSLVRTHTHVAAVQLASETDMGADEDGAGRDTDTARCGGRWLVVSQRREQQLGSSDSGGSCSSGSAERFGGSAGAASGSSGSSCGSSDGLEQRELYDAVVVCNGHYSDPRLPEVPGMVEEPFDTAPAVRGGSSSGGGGVFPGQQLHSHNYRTPEKWKSKVVLVVGASNSGEDISRELSEAGARRVMLAARSWKNEAWGADAAPYGPGGNIYRYPMVAELHADGSATFTDGRREGPIDAVIYCTGYRYAFPFLRGAAAAAARVQDNCVGPLWLDMLPPGPLAPELSFIGLPWKVVPFPQMELQSRLVARLLSGRVQLPGYEKMEADIGERFEVMRQQNLPMRYFHMLGAHQFAYNDLLVQLCGPDVEPLPRWREVLYNATSVLKRTRPEHYRDEDLAETAGSDAAAAIAAAGADAAAHSQRLLGDKPWNSERTSEHTAAA